MALSYYLLPAVAITLKIRRRKLSLSSPSVTSSVATSKSDFISFLNASLEQLPKEKQVESSVDMKSADVLTVEKLTFKAFATNLSSKITGLILQR
jgi:hypothetical protein